MVDSRLYILMRSDMASMNAGKAMAQASHASNAFIKVAHEDGFAEDWENQTQQGFGTVIVLDGIGLDEIQTTVDFLTSINVECGMVLDPTYPLKDGDYLHLIPVYTCAWVYMEERNADIVKLILSGYKLHA